MGPQADQESSKDPQQFLENPPPLKKILKDPYGTPMNPGWNKDGSRRPEYLVPSMRMHPLDVKKKNLTIRPVLRLRIDPAPWQRSPNRIRIESLSHFETGLCPDVIIVDGVDVMDVMDAMDARLRVKTWLTFFDVLRCDG